MKPGTFSLSLAVKDISTSKQFYEQLGFEALSGCGSIEDKWLIMKSDSTMIGLFQDMFNKNILTFNPQDARSLEAKLMENGINIDKKTEGNEGPAHFTLTDPDGNHIMFDQF